jgi:hypothetical protein
MKDGFLNFLKRIKSKILLKSIQNLLYIQLIYTLRKKKSEISDDEDKDEGKTVTKKKW